MTLDQLAIQHSSDKVSTHHNYCEVYEHYFEPLRNEPLTLLELGIGGYEYPDRGGASLKMWYEYFPNAHIIGMDVHEKSGLQNDRTKVLQGSQDDEAMMYRILTDYTAPDIIIDDASHINPLTIKAFEVWFPALATGGLYIVEDIETSWGAANEWAKGCDNADDLHSLSTINFFRKLLNDVNAQYIPHYTAKYDIRFVHFYKNIIVIKKL